MLQGTGCHSTNRISAQLEVRGSETHHVWNSSEPPRSEVNFYHSQFIAEELRGFYCQNKTTTWTTGTAGGLMGANDWVMMSAVSLWCLRDLVCALTKPCCLCFAENPLSVHISSMLAVVCVLPQAMCVCVCVCNAGLYTCFCEDSQRGIWLPRPLTDLLNDQETFSQFLTRRAR